MTVYPYADRNLLETPERYFYSDLAGPDFLSAYRASRMATLTRLAGLPDVTLTHDTAPVPTGYTPVDDLLDRANTDGAVLRKLLRRFEVTRRIHAAYDARIVTGTGPADRLAPYARLAVIAAETARQAGDLNVLNAALKLGDLLASQTDAALAGCAGLAHDAITAELSCVTALEAAR